jgi:hypothetical protein
MESGTGPFSFEELQHEQEIEIETETSWVRVAIVVAPLELVGDPVPNRIDPD